MVAVDGPLASLVDVSEAAAAVADGLNNTWYAVAHAADLGADAPFATRLWGEPVVLYRDAEGEVTCVRDVCPHRSAPLSMGEMKDGELRCFYHGWGFGSKGACKSVPTMPKGSAPPSFCATAYATVEHDGHLWVWRGHPLAADARKLPPPAASAAAAAAAREAAAGFVVETTLDYGVEWSALVERSLGAPHLCVRSAVTGELTGRYPRSGRAEGVAASAVSPTVVRHADVDGGALLGVFEEQATVVPIAPARSRLLLRQTFDPSPVLSFLLSLPGFAALMTYFVQNWNYQMALEDYARTLAGSGAAAGAGAERVGAFREWLASAQSATPEAAAYFARWADSAQRVAAAPLGPQRVDEAIGTYGLKKNYVRDTPLAVFAPLQTSGYVGLLDRYKALQQSIAAALLTAPAGLLTYKTVAPAMAAVFGSHS